MAKFTNVELSFERSVKKADYENAKFAARFSVLIEDGDDAEEITNLYGRQIVRFVEERLGLRSEINVLSAAEVEAKREAKRVASIPGIPATAVVQAAEEAKTEKVKGTPGRPKKDKPAEATEAAPAVSDAPVVAITDTQLTEAITSTVAHLADEQSPAQIKHLVQSFFPEGSGKVWGSRELPQNRRQEFLDRLADMKAAKAKAKKADDVADI